MTRAILAIAAALATIAGAACSSSEPSGGCATVCASDVEVGGTCTSKGACAATCGTTKLVKDSSSGKCSVQQVKCEDDQWRATGAPTTQLCPGELPDAGGAAARDATPSDAASDAPLTD